MSKRELIDTGTDKRYVRRDKEGKFKEGDDVSRSLSTDARRDPTHDAKPGQGDKGDRKHRCIAKLQPTIGLFRLTELVCAPE